ncbi:hypothetical protein PVAND_009573 [Polypedilum vanderplanki]|uniref:Uncharacterized protein n=1 Tax=Polypedilum vanderplanki TaxID=319348 RepID=A0A9J6CDB2_POLVA|nr:hypothetical protein PVAND_009573 [Polypedilum vanderplanki]
MNSLDKTLLTSSEDELKLIYEEENQKLLKNQLIFDCLKKLTIDDFPKDLNENSRKNIEKALLSARINDFLDLGNGQTLLNLENFKLSNVKLSYTEKKTIHEQVEKLVRREVALRSQDCSLENDIKKAKNKFIELTKENTDLIITLERLKNEELNLLKEVTDTFLGSDQKLVVQNLLEEAEYEEARIKNFCNKSEEFLVEQTSKSKNVLLELSAHLDDLIRKKNEKIDLNNV